MSFREWLLATVMIIGGWTLLFTSVWSLTGGRSVRYNCELAEISPDFPVEVRKQCRELRAKQ